MKMTKLFVALASMLALSSVASASTVYNVGQLTSTPTATAITLAPGAFDDYIAFSIASPYVEAAGGVMNIPMTISLPNLPTLTLFDVSNLAASLYSGTCTAFSCSPASFIGNATMTSPDHGVMSGILMPGSYFLEVTGKATGLNGGMLTFTGYAAPVPEPESYAMFLAGLGLMGAIARRRKNG